MELAFSHAGWRSLATPRDQRIAWVAVVRGVGETIPRSTERHAAVHIDSKVQFFAYQKIARPGGPARRPRRAAW